MRVWNRGAAAAKNVFATIYYSPPATLVTPSMWTLIGDSYYPNVPTGSTVEVTTIGFPWPADQIPAAGHIASWPRWATTTSRRRARRPWRTSRHSRTITITSWPWRNFNVVDVPAGQIKPPFGPLFPLPFHLTGAWRMKNDINSQDAHTNIAASGNIFGYDPDEKAIITSFFDFEDNDIIQADLLVCAQAGLIGFDLLLAVRDRFGGFIAQRGVVDEWHRLREANGLLFHEMLSKSRWDKLRALMA